MAQHTIETQILVAQTPSEIVACFSTMQELRPKLRTKEAFVEQIKRQQVQGYKLCYILDEGEVVACIGFRIFETTGWGKILYIDDLVTREKSRKKGFGSLLLEYAILQGQNEKCQEVHLDSGPHRHDAHRLYLNRGFTLNCYHLALVLNFS